MITEEQHRLVAEAVKLVKDGWTPDMIKMFNKSMQGNIPPFISKDDIRQWTMALATSAKRFKGLGIPPFVWSIAFAHGDVLADRHYKYLQPLIMYQWPKYEILLAMTDPYYNGEEEQEEEGEALLQAIA